MPSNAGSTASPNVATRSTSGFAPVEQAPALVAGADDATRLSYRLNVGRATRDAGRAVELRVQYLTVAGT